MGIVGASRVKIVLAIFTIAVFYASVCSTTCAVGTCPNLAQHSESRHCDQPSSQHSSNSHDHGPENSDCSAHSHPSIFVKASGIPVTQLTSTVYLKIGDLVAYFCDRLNIRLSTAWGSDLAPPIAPKVPLHQQSFALRI